MPNVTVILKQTVDGSQTDLAVRDRFVAAHEADSRSAHVGVLDGYAQPRLVQFDAATVGFVFLLALLVADELE